MPLAVDVPDPRRNWFRPCGASSVVANANPMLSAAIFTKIQSGMRRSDGKVYCAPRNISHRAAAWPSASPLCHHRNPLLATACPRSRPPNGGGDTRKSDKVKEGRPASRPVREGTQAESHAVVTCHMFCLQGGTDLRSREEDEQFRRGDPLPVPEPPLRRTSSGT